MNYFNSLLNNYHRLILQGSQNLIRFTLLCQNLWKKYNDATRYNLFRNDLFYDIITPIAKVSKLRIGLGITGFGTSLSSYDECTYSPSSFYLFIYSENFRDFGFWIFSKSGC